MVVRLSDIRAKTGQKCIFCDFKLFFPLCQTASQPYRLSYIDALCINQSYQPKDGSVKFSRKNFKNWQFWKTAILKNRPFWIFFVNSFFFLLHSHENQTKFVWYNGWVEILTFSLVSRKFLAMRNIMLYMQCTYIFNLLLEVSIRHTNTYNYIGTIKIPIWMSNWDVETHRNKLKNNLIIS